LKHALFQGETLLGEPFSTPAVAQRFKSLFIRYLFFNHAAGTILDRQRADKKCNDRPNAGLDRGKAWRRTEWTER
jgi:hypothetical protein